MGGPVNGVQLFSQKGFKQSQNALNNNQAEAPISTKR
jgi:hypothetical protein